LGRGHKPSEVVPADPQTIATLLGTGIGAGSLSPELPTHEKRWFDAVMRTDEAALQRELQNNWVRRDALHFLDSYLGPLLVSTGERWANGEISIYQEHFGSEVVISFLTQRWRALSAVQHQRVVVCATFPGEQHTIGLHMAAVTMALAGWRLLFIGQNTPVNEIANAATTNNARAIAIGSSPITEPALLQHFIDDLLPKIRADVTLCLGGCKKKLGGQVNQFSNMTSLFNWATSTASPHSKNGVI